MLFTYVHVQWGKHFCFSINPYRSITKCVTCACRFEFIHSTHVHLLWLSKRLWFVQHDNYMFLLPIVVSCVLSWAKENVQGEWTCACRNHPDKWAGASDECLIKRLWEEHWNIHTYVLITLLQQIHSAQTSRIRSTLYTEAHAYTVCQSVNKHGNMDVFQSRAKQNALGLSVSNSFLLGVWKGASGIY